VDQKYFNNYFLILFSLVPLSVLIGPTISLSNILIICILSFFTFFNIYKKEYNFLSSYQIKLIILLYLYLIFNSFIAIDFMTSAKRNFGFIRFIFLFIACNYFFFVSKKTDYIFKFWSIVLLIVIFDVYYESIIGKNILGYGETIWNVGYGKRIVSFFKTEPVVGFYVYSLFFIVLGYFFNHYKSVSNYKKTLIILFSILTFIAILLTGERSNTIKCFLALLIFYSLNDNFSIKKKLTFLLSVLIILFIAINNVPYLKKRYITQIYQILTQKDQHWKLEKNIYLNLYLSAYNVFKNYPFFGVGNKNYRVETCETENAKKYSKENDGPYLCITHPHQVYFEFLAEHGLIGSVILLFIFFDLIFRKLKVIILSKNYIQIGCLIYLVINFIPILPGGSFFGDFKSTFFWLNLCILYSVSKNTNIFYLLDKNHNFTNRK